MKKLKYKEINLTNGAKVTHATVERSEMSRRLTVFKISMLAIAVTLVLLPYYL